MGGDHAQQHSTNTRTLAESAQKVNVIMTDPEYNPMSVPLGTLTAVRTPHPQCSVLNTWSGTFRGFCATRVRHVSSQEQFCTEGKNIIASDCLAHYIALAE